MSCKCARTTDEYHGWKCTITEMFGEGPDVDKLINESEDK